MEILLWCRPDFSLCPGAPLCEALEVPSGCNRWTPTADNVFVMGFRTFYFKYKNGPNSIESGPLF